MKELETNILDGGNKLIIGDRATKSMVMREYIKNHTGALIVFDYDGRLYESCEGDAILVDFSSEGSVVPDLWETLLYSEYGESPKSFAATMQKLVIHTKPDRGSNDAFWTNIASSAFRQYIEYLAVIYKMDKYSLSSGRNQGRGLASLGQYANEMMNLMNRVTEGQKQDRSTVSGAAKATPAYTETPLYKLLHKYEQASRGKDALPFDGTLRNPGSVQTNTFQCAYITMLTMGDSFFKMMEMMERSRSSIARLPQLALKDFISEAPAPLFLCGTRKAGANQAIASLTLMAAACAASKADAKVTVLIPEIERWNLQGAMKFVREECFEQLCTISSFSDIRKLSSNAGIDKKSVMNELTEASDGILWLHATDPVLEEIFESASTAKERRYKLNELSEYFAAYYDRCGLQYFSLPIQDEAEKVTVRERKPMGRAIREPWIEKCSGREKKFLEDTLYGGLPKDLYEDLTRLGYAKAKHWQDKQDKEGEEEQEAGGFFSAPDSGSLNKRVFYRLIKTYDRRAICSFLLDDRARLTRRERGILNCKPFGEEKLFRYFAECDIRWLYGRVRAQLKKIKEETERDEDYDKTI